MTDCIEISALVLGPVAAVGLTLWREHLRQARERRIDIMRQFSLTKSNPSDPNFSAAVNLIPIEFGHEDKIMTAWEEFIAAAQAQKANTDQINELSNRMMLSLGYRERAASQVARSDYTSTGLADQRKQAAEMIGKFRSIAKSLEINAQATTLLAEHAGGKSYSAATGNTSLGS